MPLAMVIDARRLLSLHLLVADISGEEGYPVLIRGEREPGRADAAVHRPFAQFGGQVLFDDDIERAAALVHAVVAGHVFHDGNKRTSVAALVVWMDTKGWVLTCT